MGNWISCLTVCSVDYMAATKHMLEEEIQSKKNNSPVLEEPEEK